MSSRRWRGRDARMTDEQVDMLVARDRAAIAAVLDRELSTRAGLARIYAAHGLPAPPGQEEAGLARPAADDGGELQAVCDQIAMLETTLAHASRPEAPSGQAGMYLSAASRFLYELRSGLAERTMTAADASRLLTSVRHDFDEAERTLRGEQRLPVGPGVLARLGELRDLVGDLSGQLPALDQDVMRLFGHSDDPASVPLPLH
jgi:hypothetical protein